MVLLFPCRGSSTPPTVLKLLEERIQISSLKNHNQLSNVLTNSVILDKRGWLWIGTSDGLNRYDGNDYRHYRPGKKHTKSISHYNVNDLLEDLSGIVWAATQNGLNFYKEYSDTFIELNNSNINGEIVGKRIENLYEDSSGRLWFTTKEGGIHFINKHRTKVTAIEKNREKNLKVRSFLEESKDSLLAATSSGLVRISFALPDAVNIEQFEEGKEVVGKFSTVLIDASENKILVGSKLGLSIYDKKLNIFKPILRNKINNRAFTTIEKINEAEFLIGTRQSGVFLINLFSELVVNYKKEISMSSSIRSNQIHSIQNVKPGHSIVATNNGISIFSENSSGFFHLKSKAQLTDCMNGNDVHMVSKDSNENLWIGVIGGGLNRIDLNANTCRNYKATANGSLIRDVITTHQTGDGTIWIGMFRGGVAFKELDSDFFTKLEFSDSSKTTSIRLVSKIISDNSRGIWFSTFNKGVFSFDPKTKRLKSYPAVLSNKLTAAKIFDIKLDFAGNLWVATDSHGLWRKGVDEQDLRQVKHDKFPIPNTIQSLHIHKDDIWLGTLGKGAYKFNFSNDSYEHYDVNNGLLSNSVLSMQTDQNENTWLLTDKGLTRLSSNKVLKTFTYKDGLQSDSFTTTSFYDKANNVIWTGGINGINWFNPDQIDEEQSDISTLITNLEVNFKPVSFSSSPILNSPIELTESINLEYFQNNFGFRFSAPVFIRHDEVKYRSRLVNYSDQWNQSSHNGNRINFTNIDPGTYRFEVQASLDDSWNGPVSSIDITIAAPWWKTNTAYIIYLISIIFAIYSMITFRTKSLTKRALQLEQSVENRTRELASEKVKVEELLSQKNEEFANVSHEFRTPLTLILGPIAQLLKKPEYQSDTNKLSVIQRNGYRLLRMVDQLLNMETFRVKAITQKSPQAIGQTTLMLAEAFSDLAAEKGIRFNIGKIDQVNFEFTPDAYEKIILNLLSNALKYTQPGGEISIDANRHMNDYLVKVSDTGIGIPEDKLEQVFERFNRVLDDNSEQVTGAGIGLALVKSLVESHSGKIKLSSKLGEGTTIALTLPIINEVSTEQVSTHANDEIIAMEMMSLNSGKRDDIVESSEVLVSEQSNLATVLVIEDNSDMRQYICQSISGLYKVIEAQNGLEGFEVAKQEVPDLIISDVMMPKMDGYQTTHELRKDSLTNHIPVILLTARGDRESRLKGWYEKADEYLTKPFDVEELLIRVNNLLEIRDILKRRFSESVFDDGFIEKKRVASKSHIENQQEEGNNSSLELEQHKNEQQLIFIAELNDTIDSIYQDPKTNVALIATKVAMSERQLFRKLKSVLDMTPTEYLRRYRLEKAKQMLVEGKAIGFTSFEVGFSSQSYFAKCFKAQFGVSPSEFSSSATS